LAECPANQLGTKRTVQSTDVTVLDNIYTNNWAMYAGVEFGNNEYQKSADSIKVIASSATDGGVVEVYIDSIDESTKIAECNIASTGSWTSFETFSAKLLSNVSGNHDVYLLFTGSGSNKLFMQQSFYFTEEKLSTGTMGENIKGPRKYELEQNYPNPFNPTTVIKYQLPVESRISLKVYNLIGQVVTTLYDGFHQSGNYSATFNAEGLSSGVYYYRIKTGTFSQTKKMIFLK